jgi:hypothetical protein
MLADINFQLRQVYSFNVYPTALLSTDFSNVTIKAIMDPISAGKEIDIYALHAQMYPMLPPGSPNSAEDYDYVKIQTTAGNTTILGMAWIDANTVQLVQASTITAVISNVSAVDMNRILNALVQNGYSAVNLSIK